MNRRGLIKSLGVGIGSLALFRGLERPAEASKGVSRAATAEVKRSEIRDCLVNMRKGDSGPLFWQHEDGQITIHLNGYAIVPMEDYRALQESAGVEVSAFQRSATPK